MASPPPFRKCLLCGERLQFEAIQRANPHRLMRPTEYRQLPHQCLKPGAAVPAKAKESDMGNWNITINGTGAHHNADNPGDADKRFKEFVAKLKEDGQNVEHASFTHGGRENLLPGQ